MSTNTSGLSSSDEVENASLDKKVEIAQRFDREMKDYAKATVKEFLGIYGYEEDVDMEESSSAEIRQTEATTTSSVYPHTTVSAVDSQPSGECREDSTSPVSPVSKSPEKEVEHNVTSVSISSSPSKGNADMTRFCITMSIPRNGADSEQGFTTLRFWNCIMCSTAFVGNKPDIVQRIHYPHLFTYQPEWLSHAGICTRCQNALAAVRTPKITIYAINEIQPPPPQYHPHSSYTAAAPGPVPNTPQMCYALPGQCNCAGVNVPGVHGHGINIPGIHVSEVTAPGVHGHGVNVPGVHVSAAGVNVPGVHGHVVNVPGTHISEVNAPGVQVPAVQTVAYPGVKIKTEPFCEETDSSACSTQYARKADLIFRPITCTQ